MPAADSRSTITAACFMLCQSKSFKCTVQICKRRNTPCPPHPLPPFRKINLRSRRVPAS